MKSALEIYLITQADAVPDQLTENDWQQLKEIADALEPFHLLSTRLQGQGSAGSHGVIWETLPALDYLSEYCEKKINQLRTQQEEEGRHTRRNSQHSQPVNPLQVAYQNAWEKLQKYNDLTDEAHEIYAAAALLNPCLRKRYFDTRWTDNAALYIPPMIEKNKSIWKNEYSQISVTEPSEELHSAFDIFLANSQHLSAAGGDEFDQYINGSQTQFVKWKEENLFEWWQQYPVPSLRQWAFDTLSIPAMSAEIERVFSSSRRTITVDRNSLSNERFEALQCLKHWMDNGLLQ